MFPYEWLDSDANLSDVGLVGYEDFNSSLTTTIKKNRYE